MLTEAEAAGARRKEACEVLGVSIRTVQNWIRDGGGEDMRQGPKSAPPNKFTEKERKKVVETVTSPEFADLSPRQIVPTLADRGEYVGSESTIYRILEQEGLKQHRGPTRPRKPRPKPPELTADGPNQLYSWDITYLRGPAKGTFFFLYLFLDIWSRKIVGWRVEEHEDSAMAAELIEEIVLREDVAPGTVSLHNDNGAPMKGSPLKAKLEDLHVMQSFSRPSVKNDNPYSEAIFRTLKYRPEYPSRPFASLDAARAWVEEFVNWYNEIHLHSGLSYVTPSDRHTGQDQEILKRRRRVYLAARRANPSRWSKGIRAWKYRSAVTLNPGKPVQTSLRPELRAA